ncbi:MAG: hypothetical protein KDE19_24200, partial [Caldilineaceae bacterium]|nr:hypothetical protein [Caldilineaceae bacterium]
MNNPHNSTKVSARPYTVGAWLFLFLVATVLWQRATTVTIWAQGREETETIPGGTIPGDQVLFLPI